MISLEKLLETGNEGWLFKGIELDEAILRLGFDRSRMSYFSGYRAMDNGICLELDGQNHVMGIGFAFYECVAKNSRLIDFGIFRLKVKCDHLLSNGSSSRTTRLGGQWQLLYFPHGFVVFQEKGNEFETQSINVNLAGDSEH